MEKRNSIIPYERLANNFAFKWAPASDPRRTQKQSSSLSEKYQKSRLYCGRAFNCRKIKDVNFMWGMPRIKMHSSKKLFQHPDLKGCVSLPANVANMSPSHLPLERHLNENSCSTHFPKLPLT